MYIHIGVILRFPVMHTYTYLAVYKYMHTAILLHNRHLRCGWPACPGSPLPSNLRRERKNAVCVFQGYESVLVCWKSSSKHDCQGAERQQKARPQANECTHTSIQGRTLSAACVMP